MVDANGNVDFVNAAGQVVLSVTPKAASYWDASGQNVQLVDFSKLAEAGKYSIKVNGNVLRSDLVVKSQTYEDIVKASIKWFYYQRASMALESQYAGKWARAAGHTNPTAELHNSTGASGTINSSKGWYDAGDYGRYIVNSGITTYTLLSPSRICLPKSSTISTGCSPCRLLTVASTTSLPLSDSRAT